jgi:hypothetical protein
VLHLPHVWDLHRRRGHLHAGGAFQTILVSALAPSEPVTGVQKHWLHHTPPCLSVQQSLAGRQPPPFRTSFSLRCVQMTESCDPDIRHSSLLNMLPCSWHRPHKLRTLSPERVSQLQTPAAGSGVPGQSLALLPTGSRFTDNG